MLLKITNLLHSIEQNPFKGIGKPEPLKYKYAGLWSPLMRWLTNMESL
ncbi:MAG: type II toxin-antitoxin system YoeB family toxin [Saprospiraceae bacterium]|nr:type II toxin-antitoxin system YoeB family toxin [Saprospiraceae bacterium]